MVLKTVPSTVNVLREYALELTSLLPYLNDIIPYTHNLINIISNISKNSFSLLLYANASIILISDSIWHLLDVIDHFQSSYISYFSCKRA